VHCEAHLAVSVRCVDRDTVSGSFGSLTSVFENDEGVGTSWSSCGHCQILNINSSGVGHIKLKTGQITSLDSGSRCKFVGCVEVSNVLLDTNINIGGRSRCEDVVDVNSVVNNGVGSVTGVTETDGDVLSLCLFALVGEVNKGGGDVFQSGCVGVHLDRCVDVVSIFPCCGVAVGEHEGGVVGAEFTSASCSVGGHVVDVPVVTTDTVEPIRVQCKGGEGTVASVIVWILAEGSVLVNVVEGCVAGTGVVTVGVNTNSAVEGVFISGGIEVVAVVIEVVDTFIEISDFSLKG